MEGRHRSRSRKPTSWGAEPRVPGLERQETLPPRRLAPSPTGSGSRRKRNGPTEPTHSSCSGPGSGTRREGARAEGEGEGPHFDPLRAVAVGRSAPRSDRTCSLTEETLSRIFVSARAFASLPLLPGTPPPLTARSLTGHSPLGSEFTRAFPNGQKALFATFYEVLLSAWVID